MHSTAQVSYLEDSSAFPKAFGRMGADSRYCYASQEGRALLTVWNWKKAEGAQKTQPFYRASLPEKMTAMAFTQDASICFEEICFSSSVQQGCAIGAPVGLGILCHRCGPFSFSSFHGGSAGR